WVPSGALVARILQADRTTDGLGQHGRIHGGIAGIVAAVSSGTGLPDAVHLIGREPENGGDAVTRVVRFRGAGPQGRATVLELDDCAGRPHAGMRLERPLVVRLDHPCGVPERLIHAGAVVVLDLALAHRGAADVIVEPGWVGERRLGRGPFDLELPR